MLLRPGALALLILLVTAPLARAAVGFQQLTIQDPQGASIEVGVWYPTNAAPTLSNPDLAAEALAPNGPVEGHGLPLVVISHGTGGDFAGHSDTAAALAEAGFVAAALTHTGDNWRDHSAALRIWDRPRQLTVLIDYMLQAWPARDHINPGRIGAFGFSAGGFTVLAAAGGEPDLSAIGPHCIEHPQAFECRLRAGAPGPAPDASPVTHDPRIRAIVAAAPALGYTFSREGLAQVRLPVQLWRAENDQVLPHPYHAEAVRAALPTEPETHVVAAAGHFDFLRPCSAAITQHAPEICKSAPGFDRAAFHADFNRAVVAFFERTLTPASAAAAPGGAARLRRR